MVDRLHHNPLSRKGFNLIEAAIVLAVVGGVIGGIWVAAASISERLKVNKTTAGILQIVTGVRHVFGRESHTQTTDVYVTPAVINAGIFPRDWELKNDHEIYSPLSIRETVEVFLVYNTVELANSGDHGIEVTFYNAGSDSECTKIAMGVGSHFKDQTDLAYVAIGSASYIRSFPPLIEEVTADCKSRGGNPGISFVFTP